MKRTDSICDAILKDITPTKEERIAIHALATELEEKVASTARDFGLKAIVRTEGSVAKDTWLSGDPDIDVFLRIPREVPRRSLGEIALKVARKATEGSAQVERFAEHPYLEATIGKTRINIVPCYEAKQGEWLSATDRTPFHTEYIKRNLRGKMRGEVRLLKKFMKGVGVYGAEIKIGGFSGYLTELLVLNYGSFRSVLRVFAEHKEKLVIDIENHYTNRERETQLLFTEPLVVVDPVDGNRNVASAVRAQRLDLFSAAAQAFETKPSRVFFDPPPTAPLSVKALKTVLKKRGSSLIFVVFGRVEAVPDVLWGQLYKSQRSLSKLVKNRGFNLLRDFAWSDENKLSMFAFELEQQRISKVKLHQGPPLNKKHECREFLAKHLNSREAFAGPYVEGGRWVVQIRRRDADVEKLFRERLKDGGKDVGVAKRLALKIAERFSILVNSEIADIYGENSSFAEFLTDFLSGRPKWLESAKTSQD